MLLISAVESGFRQKLKDVVAMNGERAQMTFSTNYTSPYLIHYSLDETYVTLVSYGIANPRERSATGFFTFTSIRRESDGFNVSLIFHSVEPQDAGTYVAKDDNARRNSEKNYAELIVIGKLQNDKSSYKHLLSIS